jgi:asparagine synthase (glutamine-hydrolysing)
MLARMARRGPDGEGEWADADAGIWLGHRRLAVLDLTSEGSQPMHSHSGRYVLSYNGEIYNHRALRTELESSGVT